MRYTQTGGSWADHSFTGTGTSTERPGLTAGKRYEVQVRGTDAEGTGNWSGSGTAITQYTTQTRSIAENSASGTNVGAAVDADSNPNGHTLSYSLSGTDASSFSINSSSGQITTATGTTLDYETKTSYSVIVTMAASGGSVTGTGNTGLSPNGAGNYVIPVTINVSNVNEGPEFADDTATRSIAENSAAGTSIGAAVVAGADPEGDSLTYSLSGTDASKLDIGASTGQITVKTGNVPDYESQTSYSVTVNVSDKKAADGTANTAIDDTIAVTINVTDVTEPPSKPSAPTVAANTTTPTTKLDVTWSEPTNTGPDITDYDVRYRLSGTTNWTEWDASTTSTTRKVTITGLTVGKRYDAQVRAESDEGTSGWSDTGSGTTNSNAVTRSIAENSAAGTNIGAAVTASANTNGYTLTHSLSGTDASSFSIESSSGQIKVKSALDYETKSSYSVVVTVKAAQAGVQSQSFTLDPNAPGDYDVSVTINVTDKNDAPEFPSPTATRSIAENSASGTNIGAAVTATDQDGDTLHYTLTGTDASSFNVGSTTGQITVKSALDYETKSSYSVTVNVSDKKDADGTADTVIDDTIAVTISVTDEQYKPAKVDIIGAAPKTADPRTTLIVTWNEPLDRSVSGGKTADPDYDDVDRFFVAWMKETDTDWTNDSSFKIIDAVDGSNDPVTSYEVTGLDRNTTYQFRMKAQDEFTNYGPEWSNVVKGSTVDNLDPTFPEDTATRSIAENSAAGTNIGTAVTATDPYPTTDTLYYTLTGTDAGKFNIGSTTGQITVKTGNIPDYEAKTSYSVTVNVSDKKASDGTADTAIDDTIAVTINVTDVNEPPPAPAAPTVAANTTTPTSKLDVSWTAPTMTGKPAITDYDVQYRLTNDTGAWTSHAFTGTGTSTTLTGLTSGKSYDVQVRAVNDEGDGAWSASGDAITRAGGVTRSIAENSAAGTNVGAAVTATSNTNSYDLTHALSGTDASKFTIESSSGQIKVKTGTSLDYETKTSYSVTVTVAAAVAQIQSFTLDPNAPGDYVVPVTINVTNVNEGPEFSAATATRSIAENSAANSNVGAVVTAGADPEGDTVTYSLSGTDASKFDIGSSTGQITVASGTSLDYESKTSYSVTVNVTDKKAADGTANTAIDDTIAVTINVTDVNEPPPAPAAPTVAQNATTPATKLDVSWTAPSTAGKPAITDYDVQYRLTGTSTWTSHSFSGTGTSTTLTGLTSGNSYDVQVRAVNDEGDGAWSASGDAITKADGVTRSVAENSDAGTNVGAAVTTTANTNGYTLSHSLSGTDASKFTIASSSGQIKVKTGTTLDYESGTTSYSVVVTVTASVAGAQGQSWTLDPNAPGSYVIPVTINVTDADEPPPMLAEPSVWQHSATPKTQLDVSWTAPTTAQMADRPAVNDYDVQYKKSDDSDWTTHSFTGTGTTTRLTGLDEGTEYDVQVRAVNDEGDGAWSDSGTASTQDANVNATFPTATATRSVAENTAANTNLGAAFTATDTEGNTLTYSLTGVDAASFSLDTSTGQLKTKAALDYEDKTSYSVTIGVSDGKDSNDNADTTVDDTIEVTINVTDVNEPPPKPGAPTVAPNAATPKTKLDVSWTAPDVTGKPAITDYDVQYRVKASPANSWSSHAFTGTGTSTTLTGLDAGPEYEVQVLAKNDEGSSPWSDSGTATTQDANVNPMFAEDTATRSVAENTAVGTAIGAAFTATDTEGDTLTYSLSGTDASHFTLDTSTGQLKVKAGNIPNYEAKTSYSVTVGVSDGKDSDNKADTKVDDTIAVTINVTDVLEPPAAPAAPKVATNATTPTTKLDVSWTAPDMKGKPAITGYDVRYRLVGDAWKSHSVTGTRTSTTLTGLTAGKSYDVQVLAKNDEGTSGWSASGRAITHANAVTRGIDENSAAGANVGAAVTATSNPGGHSLTHALSGADASKFAINASTGQITVGSGTTLDYESGTTSYSVVVTVTASGASVQAQSWTLVPNAMGSYVVPVAINVTDVNEPPGPPTDVTAVWGYQPKTTFDVSWVEPDMTGKPHIKYLELRYREKGTTATWSDPLWFGVGQSVGNHNAGTLHDLEPGTTYLLQVRAINDEGAGAWSDPGQGSTQANVSARTAPPPQSAPDEAAPSEPATQHPIVLVTPGEGGATPPRNESPLIANPGDKRYRQGDAIAPFGIDAFDDGGPPRISVLGLPSGLAFDADAGMVLGRVALDAPLGAHRVTIRASDGERSAAAAFTITVTERPAQPASPATGHGPAGASGLGGGREGAAALLLLALAAALPMAARRRVRA